ncbi:Pln1p [Kluyveromyces lactis]|uniref:KLLA0E15027p n=1 Tax=Kluyveromyces lactis (strain ATCC 8585 / CBS 2359 / DSM 70799 / NBRC 1267 / NRRL Y-1140 / WM37) TaxID=284590 RepID=Q6CN62_KLULA|nr:uncharacterized protein KLLA0_E15027g [Kluyveromyces lactis]CAG99714.1 KLLA0E15027p [Kluyveromyces lactis]|eukprot:XP_454627.1 uncharacterized protein KLLA0_E15027g [Kluyveromyces lactis]
MTGPVKKQRSRSSSSVRLVVDKPSTDKFATQYATINHLNKYPTLIKWLNALLSLSLVSNIISTISLILFQFRIKVIESPKTPTFVKRSFNRSVAIVKKLDEFINTLVFREGIDTFVEEYHDHGKLGVWVAYFVVDYTANVVNYTVKELILRPLSLIKDETHPSSSGKSVDLPHFKELGNTTKDVLEPTKEKFVARYDNLVKPAKDGYEQAISTAKETYSTAYKTVSDKYDTNFKETESVPRAILTTGSDLGSLTIEKLKKYNGVGDESNTTVDTETSVKGLKGLST